jgi:hypothetical protein
MTTALTFDPKELEAKVKAMYRSVAENPHGEFHFEMGRAMAERLGYNAADLDHIPQEAIESFAGVGYYFHLAEVKEGAHGRKRTNCKIVGSADDMKIATAETIAGLLSRAAASPRKRMNLNLHAELTDPIARFLNAGIAGTYVRPHRHRLGKWELVSVLHQP